jgi:septal ring-binding cell division protein DamX
MDNKDNTVTLSKNKDITLMGDVKITTSDQSVIDDANPLRYYISKEMTIEGDASTPAANVTAATEAEAAAAENVTAATEAKAVATENVAEAKAEEAKAEEAPAVENKTAEAAPAAEAAPGFEGLFAIAGLLAVSYLVLGRRE